MADTGGLNTAPEDADSVILLTPPIKTPANCHFIDRKAKANGDIRQISALSDNSLQISDH